MLLKVNNHKVDNIKEFFFDGCHKIYLIEDEEDKKKFIGENNYLKEDIYPIEDLEKVFANSCPLRFINTCKLKTIVPQCKKSVKFVYDDKICIEKF